MANKTCITCGKSYKYCPSCGHDKDKPTWMNIFCSENCRTLFNTATNYYGGDITKEQAKEIVDKANLSKIDKFRPDVVKMIKEVQAKQNSSFENSVKASTIAASTFTKEDEVKEVDVISKIIDKVEAESENKEEQKQNKRSFKPSKGFKKAKETVEE